MLYQYITVCVDQYSIDGIDYKWQHKPFDRKKK